jgi:3-hydroxy-9,10-secoandrosta-1,3,5(10)-triene-9,17-dione monooxygenase reductase component
VSQSPESPELADLVSGHSIDAAHFRAVLGHFCTGVTIVTGSHDGEPAGLTCQAFTSLSLEPPLVAFCPSLTSTSWPRIRGSGAFCVNVLNEDQEDLCRVFAASGGDKFRGVGWKEGATGSPVLDDVLAWIDCRMEAEHAAGDHLIVVGRVIELGSSRSGTPLLFYRGGFGRFQA